MRWPNEMHNYLAVFVLNKIYEEIGDYDDSDKLALEMILAEISGRLSSDEIKAVKGHAKRIENSYYNYVAEEVESEFKNENYYDGDSWPEWPPIIYNEEFKNVWMDGVRQRKSVIMEYKSETTGLAERMVDPYSTAGAYGKGYCHLRKEERKFRFDRIIDIKLTDKKFIK